VAITARYATVCGVCGDAVSPGDRIQSLPSGSKARWAHDACALDSLFGELAPAGAGLAVAAAAPTPPYTPAQPATQVWTDGACSGNPGPGGWAWATADGRQGSGGSLRTTNQRMEIQAALEAVTALGRPLVVVSDSTYVVNCFRDGWWRGWIARDWVTSAKKPVANRDLWEPLVTAVRERGEITFRWVKGHSGDRMNDLVDRLAVAAAASQAGLA
jgi:ribonuclease HI